jgi:DNA-binding SARP family transcriptional activator
MLRSDTPSRPSQERPLQFAILGPLQVHHGNTRLELGPFKQRVLLAGLLCRSNAIMPVEQLLDVIWANEQPRTARKNLQVYVSALRKITGDRIRHVAYGYALQVSTDELDLLRFDYLADTGRKASQAGDLEGSRTLLGEALLLWRDRPLVDLMANSFIGAESDTLMERYLAVYEDWADLEIGAGRHLGVVERLGQLAQRNPFREKLATSLMTALSRGGNRQEALAHYEKHRQVMARELGLDPSPVLQRLYQSILGGESGIAALSAAVALVAASAKPAQLPRDLYDFVGRTEQTQTLVSVLAGSSGEGEVAVISGHTGTGKTALAVHVGHLLAHRFTDGQLFVALRDEIGSPRPWRDVLGELARGTGLETPIPAEEAAALSLWRSWVANRHFLFVLDDAVDEISTRLLLPGRGANSTIVTSSRTLGGLESVSRLQLGEFSHAEAVELLERTLGKPRMPHAGDAVRQILARCGGQPLTIHVIAAKLTVLRHLSVRAYADQLDQTADVLQELTIGEVSLRSRLERFHHGLPPHQKDAFRALGALPAPPFSHDDVLAALGGLPEPVERLLEELMDANLVAAAAETDVMAHSISYVMPTSAYLYSVALYHDAATVTSR